MGVPASAARSTTAKSYGICIRDGSGDQEVAYPEKTTPSVVVHSRLERWLMIALDDGTMVTDSET